ncbi:MAG TPA: Ni/Fe-hydrogenase cytochrome b subunit [Anaeromyxobacteraceae bacterium]|nr:Ni/Fe-hydrogenase cytochrome b subunit [Anaeromyxobacteraceae bacterium]
MANAAVTTASPVRAWVQEKIFLGMTVKEYVRSLATPANVVLGGLAAMGIALMVYRFAVGLGATTNLSQYSPWGIWIGFDMMTGIVLAAGGFTLATTVHLFGLHAYHPIVRPALLTAFLGYMLAVVGLIADLGRPWNMVFIFVRPGTTSALFEVACCVALYSSVLFLEFLLPTTEWLGLKRIRGVLMKIMLPLTILSVVFSTMHQSALGSLFLLAPGKLHPLWYTKFIFIFFFISAVMAGISMVLFEGSLSHKAFASRITSHFDVDRLQIGLARAGAIIFFAYFFLKLQGVVDNHAWGHILTGWGAWWAVEMLGFVLLPALLFAYGARNMNVKFVRIGSVLGVLGIALNRLNVSVIAFNWKLPSAVRYVPSLMEVGVSVGLVALGVVAFRFIVNRMPILGEHSSYRGSEY